MTNQHGSQNGVVRDSIIDLQTFPILTEEVHDSGVADASLVSSSSLASGGTIVEQTLRGILGWRPRTADPKGFLSALKQSFIQEDDNGRKEWVWSPRNYTVQTDIGAVTGAQASLYQRAQVALRESKPILDRLVPLRADADEEDIDASRAIVESYLTELVNEFGLLGGPRVQRIDTLFDSIFGKDFDFSNPENVAGVLGQLGNRLGLNRDEVNTLDEEQNLTDFFILVDHISALKNTFEAQRNFFDRKGNDVFLGTQLVLLARALSSLGESVIQTKNVLNSVFVGAAERESIQLPLGQNEPTITIAELLNWTGHVATEEGPRLIREGGKDGAISLTETLEELARLLAEADKLSKNGAHNPTRGFHTVRVQRSFEELTLHANEAARLAKQLTRETREKPEIVILSSFFSHQKMGDDDVLRVEVCIKNNGDETVPTQGPPPGTIYHETQTFQDLGHDEIEGAIRVGVDFDGRPDGVIDHPYRWGLLEPLAPDQVAIVTGYIKLRTDEDKSTLGRLTSLLPWNWDDADDRYWAGVVCERVAWIDTGEPDPLEDHANVRSRSATEAQTDATPEQSTADQDAADTPKTSSRGTGRQRRKRGQSADDVASSGDQPADNKPDKK